VSHRKPEDEHRQIPAWLLGLIIAAAVFIIGFIVFGALGFGDDPVIEQSVFFPLLTFQAARQRRLGD
jgi:hypothetical protein